ncbi:MAG: galactonate dehydratase [Chloroflexota bacterium]
MSRPRIAAVRTFFVHGYYRNFVFVKIETDEGIAGWGECSLEGKEGAVMGAVDDYARELTGRDACAIEAHIRTMTRDSFWMNGPVLRSAMGGLETAMWDVLGKWLGVPVHTLLGGRLRDEIEAYSNAWYFGARTAEDFAAAAELPLSSGYRALKFDPFGYASATQSTHELREAVEKVAAVRSAVGPDVRIGLDAHGRFGLMSALRLLRELDRYDLYFVEEPLHPGDASGLEQVVRQSRIPIVLGERLYSRWEYRDLLERSLVPMIQPDVIHVGGILELRKIAAMAEVYGVAIAPHNAAGPISTAATLQVAACTPNAEIQEMFAPQDAPWRDDLARPPIAVVDGKVQIPHGPGLGIELDEEVALAHPGKPRSLDFYSAGSILEIEYRPR